MSIDNVFKRTNNKTLTSILFLFAQVIFTINYLRLSAFGFTGLLKALILPAILLASCVAINTDIFKNIEWRKLKPKISYKIIALFLFGFLIIYGGLNLVTVDLHIPLMMLIVGLSISYLFMLYFEFSGNLDKAVYVFFICFPLLNLAEYWMGITKEIFENNLVFTPTVFFLISLFLGALVAGLKKNIQLFRIHIAMFTCLGVFLLSGLVSALLSISPVESLREYVLQYVYSMLMLPVVFLSIDSFEKIKTFTNILIISLLMNIILFFYIFQRIGKGLSSLIDIYGASLASGISSGTMGMLILFIFPLVLLMFSRGTNLKNRTIYSGIYLLMALLTIITFSRSGLICFILGSSVFLFSRKIKEVLIVMIVLGALFGIIFGGVLADPQTNRYLTIISGFNDYSSHVRFNAWSGAAEMIKDHPVFGIGSGMWDSYVAHYVPAQNISLMIKRGKWAQGYIVDPHNFYLRTYLETGIIGFLSWLSFVFLCLSVAFKSILSRREHFYPGIAFLSFLIANTANQLTGGVFLAAGDLFLSSLVFWGIIGLFLRSLVLKMDAGK